MREVGILRKEIKIVIIKNKQKNLEVNVVDEPKHCPDGRLQLQTFSDTFFSSSDFFYNTYAECSRRYYSLRGAVDEDDVFNMPEYF